jgi:hypothetical protein
MELFKYGLTDGMICISETIAWSCGEPLVSRKHSILCYNEPEIANAFLYNLRDFDAQTGGQISKGDIAQGAIGYAVAESTVVGWTAKTVRFRSSRKCKWQGFELPCMVHLQTPRGKSSYSKLRDFNYVVAAVINEQVASIAKKLHLPYLITSDGKPVFNLEISRFQKQGHERRATLLP